MTTTPSTDPVSEDLKYFASVLQAEKSKIAALGAENGKVADASALLRTEIPGFLEALGGRIDQAETTAARSVHWKMRPVVSGELQACRLELGRLGNTIGRISAEHGLHTPGLPDLLKQVSQSTARLSTRLKIIEQAIQSELDSAPELLDEVRITAEQLANGHNTYLLDKDARDIYHCWTGPARRNSVEIPVARSAPREVRICFIAIIKPEFVKQIEVRADGQALKTRLKFDGTFHNLYCPLAASDTLQSTLLELAVPATFSPQELGHSEDRRKLGLALCSIEAGEPLGLGRLFVGKAK
jgi:hypothetical protein